MVVTRRTPAPPLPASRTNSSQPIPRVAKGRPTGASNMPDISSPLARAVDDGESPPRGPAVQGDGVGDSPSKKSPKSSKTKQKHKKVNRKSGGKSYSFAELLTRAFLLWFIIYTLAVCPDDVKLKSPICRGLSEYRRLVVDPYILPALHRALEHPSVAPYVEKAKPYADRAVDTATPIILRTQQEWNSRVVPRYHKHVVPLWKRYAVPQIRRLDAQIAPYRAKLEQNYERRVGPHVRAATHTLSRLRHQAQPYMILAAQKTHAGYVYAKPYARPVWEKFVDFLMQLLAAIGEQRRKFVDPQVQRIWERVKELGNGAPKVPSAADVRGTVKSSASRAVQSASSVASSIISALPVKSEQATAKSSSVVEAVLSSASDIKSTIAETVASVTSSPTHANAYSSISSRVSDASVHIKDTAASVSTAASASGSSLSSLGSSLYEKASSSISSVVSVPATSGRASASSLSSVVPSFTQELASSASSLGSAASEAAVEGLASASDAVSAAESSVTAVISSLAKSTVSSSQPAVTPSKSVPVGAVEVPSVAVATDRDLGHVDETDIDMEAFYAELGLDEDDLVSEAATTSSSEPAPTPTRRAETEEERAERLRLRAIENQKKRVELDGRRDKWEKELAAKIEANKKSLRKALVALRKSATAELKDNQEIHDELKDLEVESEKLLKGAEKYLQTLQKEGKTSDDKKMLWDRVVDKVEAKFMEKLGQAEAVVNGWYLTVLNKELEELQRLTAEVKQIAEKAQTDLGMDYSWLDDVTWQDWQRYHDFVRASDNFTALATSIQDGSHPSPPINPVLTALADLQAEVQDLVVGFETRLRRVRRNGERAFDADQSEAPEAHEDETVSILPIQDEKSQSPADVPVPPVVIGRSKEEVLQALDRVAEREGQSSSSPQETPVPLEPEALVEKLAEDEPAGDHSPVSPLHEEL